MTCHLKPHSGDIWWQGGKDKSLHASDFPSVSHVPEEAEPAASECGGRVPSSLGGDVLTKPPVSVGLGRCGVGWSQHVKPGLKG